MKVFDDMQINSVLEFTLLDQELAFIAPPMEGVGGGGGDL